MTSDESIKEGDKETEDERIYKQKVQIHSKERLDEFVWMQIKKATKTYLDVFDRKWGLNKLKEFKVNIKEFHKKGSQVSYEMRANMITDRKQYHAVKEGWDPLKTYEEVIKALRKQTGP